MTSFDRRHACRGSEVCAVRWRNLLDEEPRASSSDSPPSPMPVWLRSGVDAPRRRWALGKSDVEPAGACRAARATFRRSVESRWADGARARAPRRSPGEARILGLYEMQVAERCDFFQLLPNFVGERLVVRHFRPAHRDFNRRGRAETHHLVDDIGRLERELDSAHSLRDHLGGDLSAANFCGASAREWPAALGAAPP